MESKAHYTFAKHVYEYRFLCHTGTLKDRNNCSQVEGERSDTQEGFGAQLHTLYSTCSLSHLSTGVQGVGRRTRHPLVRESEVSVMLLLVTGWVSVCREAVLKGERIVFGQGLF